MKEIYYETRHICIWYDLSQSLGSAAWYGSIPTPEFREAFLKCTEVITEKHLKNWLADNRKMEMMSQEDQAWVELMAPTVLSSGLKKMATIVSEDIFHHMAVVDLFDKVSGQLTFQNHYFRNETEALTWLECVTPSLEKVTETLQ
ncbi:hypothetical protein I5M27_17475 [Adhaeribacter sp. BT258]|uniref:SpoIIAA-like n=1 Tax=Adhaeribacter terrigena TaxID=2793070 RepID=A0ABS1C5X2_9BACT|nr:hypothetical protein [Adhaeribacter terrigena]MBK0404786.1 hypothetical protein [Adhaeribacter terrigena]